MCNNTICNCYNISKVRRLQQQQLICMLHFGASKCALSVPNWYRTVNGTIWFRNSVKTEQYCYGTVPTKTRNNPKYFVPYRTVPGFSNRPKPRRCIFTCISSGDTDNLWSGCLVFEFHCQSNKTGVSRMIRTFPDVLVWLGTGVNNNENSRKYWGIFKLKSREKTRQALKNKSMKKYTSDIL